MEILVLADKNLGPVLETNSDSLNSSRLPGQHAGGTDELDESVENVVAVLVDGLGYLLFG